MVVKIKNRTDYAYTLTAKDGETIQINAHAIRSVDDKFLADYDRMKIQLLDKVPALSQIVTTPITVSTSTSTQAQAKTSKTLLSSKK